MLVKQAQDMLAPFHNAVVVCPVPTANSFNGQLSTGLSNMPFIQINEGQVCADDVYDCIIEHTSQQTTDSVDLPYLSFPEDVDLSLFGLSHC